MKKIFVLLVVSGLISLVFCNNNPAGPEDSEFPESFDWREKNIMTPAKNQGDFGSCGVFAGVGVFEALIKKETGIDVDLSEQHVINCMPEWNSSGVSSADVLKYLKLNAVVLELELPYEAKLTQIIPSGSGTYKLNEYKAVYVNKHPLSERISMFKEAITNYGPVATVMCIFSDLPSYNKGIYTVASSARELGGHWVVVTGWVDDKNVKNGGYWICKNSSGPEWGENGYFRIAYGEAGIDDFYFCYGVYVQEED